MTGPKSINCAIWHQTTLSGGCISGSLGGCVRMMSFLSRRAKPMKWVTCDSIRSGYRCIRGNKSARAMSLIWAIVLDGWMDWMDWTRGNFQYRDVLHGGLLECPVASKNGYVGPKTVIQEKHLIFFPFMRHLRTHGIHYRLLWLVLVAPAASLRKVEVLICNTYFIFLDMPISNYLS